MTRAASDRASVAISVLAADVFECDPNDAAWVGRDRLLISSDLPGIGGPLPAEQVGSSRAFDAAVQESLAALAFASRLNRIGAVIVSHRTFLITSAEVPESSSVRLAGLLGLGRLVIIDVADANHALSGLDGWGTWEAPASDRAEVYAALRAATRDTSRPSLVRIVGRAEIEAEPSEDDLLSFTARGEGARRRWAALEKSYLREHPIGAGLLRRWVSQSRAQLEGGEVR